MGSAALYGGDRILFVDVARAYAVYLALSAHALHVFGVPDVSEFVYNYPYFTSMATPMFIFMFGVMVELVYCRKAIEGVEQWKVNLVNRSFQCYVGYALTSLSAFVLGYYGFSHFLSSLAFLADSRYGNILFIYSFSLIVMIPLVILRKRMGVWFFPLSILALLLINNAATSMTIGADAPYSYLMNRFFGVGEGSMGPSLLFALQFIILGMWVGSAINSGDSATRFYLFSMFISILILVYLVFSLHIDSIEKLKQVMTFYAYGPYRTENSLNYFFFGGFYSLVTFSLIRLFVEKFSVVRYLGVLVSPVGVCSLLVFTSGNIYLNVLGEASSVLYPSVSLTVFYVVMFLIAKYRQKVPGYARIMRALNWVRLSYEKSSVNRTRVT